MVVSARAWWRGANAGVRKLVGEELRAKFGPTSRLKLFVSNFFAAGKREFGHAARSTVLRSHLFLLCSVRAEQPDSIMAPRPPPYGSQDYWDHRFLSNTEAFEWLEAPDALDVYIADALSRTSEKKPEMLHIGCGTSSLSYHLTSHVKSPIQVHNLDYYPRAHAVGRRRPSRLSMPSPALPEEHIFCGDRQIHGRFHRVRRRPGCSYSLSGPQPSPGSMYFPPTDAPPRCFGDQSSTGLEARGSLDLFVLFGRPLWPLRLDKEASLVQEENPNAPVTHRPKLCNWVYVLQRTKVPLYVQETRK